MLDQCPIKPSIWLLCIDDISIISNESEDKLTDFPTYIITVNPAFQFTHAYSFKSVNFLDVLVTLTDDGTISTDLHTKPTDTHQYLHMNSCHTNHVKRANAFSHSTRILRICSDPATARSRCSELIEYLVRRGHGRRRTQLGVQRAIDAHRSQQQHIRNIDRGVYSIVQYHPGLPDTKGTLRKFLPIHYTSERMSMVFSRPPDVSFSQPKTFLNNYFGPNFRSLRKRSSRVNHAKAIAASSVPPLFLQAASPAPATVEHSIVVTRVQIAMPSGLCV